MTGAARDVWRALRNAGWLPAGEEEPPPFWAQSSSEDLLPAMIRLWGSGQATPRPGDGGKAGRMVRLLKGCRKQGAQLTMGVPGDTARAAQRWLGLRLVWWPRGIPRGRRVSLVSSRLGRALDNQTTWFTVLRAACAKIDRKDDLLLIASSTTTAQYVHRAATLFGLRTLRVDVPKGDALPLAKWLARLAASRDDRDDELSEAWLSPPIDTPHDPIDEGIRHIPLRDRAAVAWCDRLMAFRVRRNGHIHRLIRARLNASQWPAASVYIAIGPDLVRTEMAGELMDAGAVGWVVSGATGGRPDTAVAGPPVTAGPAATPAADNIVSVPPPDHWPYLSHCTRRRDGPWPEQDAAAHIDDLILARPDADHSALAALQRILSKRRIIATAESIRGSTRVVSFTAVPLAELGRLRVFRPHRGRWDFEPYGICIRRDWLEDYGARQVLYGDDQLWERLPPEDRPYFQLRSTRRPAAAGQIDWAVEDEWRIVGDVDLSRIPSDAAMVFVPSQPEAAAIAKLSPWPVTVVGR